MDSLFSLVSPFYLFIAMGVALLAGTVKGMVGFAMPMILISGLSTFMAPDLALAGLILSTLITNGMQALRQGPGAAWDSVKRFRAFLLVGLVALLISSQLVAIMPVPVLLALIGGPVAIFAILQIAGWKPNLANGPSTKIEMGTGAVAGFIGGLSGVWGPPVVAYLTALDTEKREQVRIQGVIYGLGAVALTIAHIGSGVLNTTTIWLSLALIPPSVLGMWLGGLVHDRIDQQAFRRATLFVLLIAALNLMRRAIFA